MTYQQNDKNLVWTEEEVLNLWKQDANEFMLRLGLYLECTPPEGVSFIEHANNLFTYKATYKVAVNALTWVRGLYECTNQEDYNNFLNGGVQSIEQCEIYEIDDDTEKTQVSDCNVVISRVRLKHSTSE